MVNAYVKINSKPLRKYDGVELFAGAGGLALGLHRAGINHILLNEFNKSACETLKQNMPNWNVLCDDVSNIDFIQYKDKIDILTGGFPCQAFSYAGKNLGFNDIRGTLFFEFARAIKEIQPKIVMGENVKGLLTHDNGKTIKIMNNVLNDLGYEMLEPKVLKAIFHKVPQKRERLILIAIKKEYFGKVQFKWPNPYTKIYTMKDALKAGDLFDVDVPKSDGQKYPSRKKEIMQMVPAGGYWRDLPINIQKEYMKNSFYLGGGKTGMARRISWDEPCLTLTCSPAQKQTERCHPIETRPLTIREYARIQTFPDSWQFVGSIASQYKQIGNAVPVNLAYEIGKSLIDILNQIEVIKK
jgi:DNA (cytosine-5)-methyltransferase 1